MSPEAEAMHCMVLDRPGARLREEHRELPACTAGKEIGRAHV